ncbi:helix-turn-helix domain-containing protein [Candidatus Kurthia intestinigallinarum]|uniref:helix-turn-helix domain-containing protein n=1 Tax=Candidatus Kurthia intestinigallinarum TaxID=1562256 RepID=UPI0026CACD10
MAKFTANEKLQATLSDLEGKESLREIAKTIGTDHKAIQNWVKQYEYHGVKAFVKRYTNCSAQFKLDVLNYMIEHGTSLLETAAIFNIAAPSTIRSWRKQYETQGFDALQSKKKGRPSMKKETNNRNRHQ